MSAGNGADVVRDRKAKSILRELADLKRELAKHNRRTEAMYDRRRVLFTEGQALDPPLLQREMAKAHGVSEVAVTAALRKTRQPA